VKNLRLNIRVGVGLRIDRIEYNTDRWAGGSLVATSGRSATVTNVLSAAALLATPLGATTVPEELVRIVISVGVAAALDAEVGGSGALLAAHQSHGVYQPALNCRPADHPGIKGSWSSYPWLLG